MTRFKAGKAFSLQKKLSEAVSFGPPPQRIEFVVGLDMAFAGRDTGVGVAAALTFPELKPVRYAYAVDKVPIPYIPGLLAFREAPLLIAAYESLGIDADLLIVDGHGVTHPRGFGLASHIGVVLGKPSIGAAKKRLVGEEVVEGDRRYLVVGGVKAALLYPPTSKKPIYLSIGSGVDLEFIEEIAPKLFRGHKLPEPTYIADRISREVRRRIVQNTGR